MNRLVSPTIAWAVLALAVSLAVPALAGVGAVQRAELVAARVPVTAADLVDLEPRDEAIRARLDEIRVARAPRIGQTDCVKRKTLRSRVASEAPKLASQIAWSGAGCTVVRAVGRDVEVFDHLAPAHAALREFVAERAARFEIEPLDRSQRVALPPGRLDVSARLGSVTGVRRRMRVLLDFAVDGEHYASIPVWFDVTADVRALVATRPLARGAEPGDVDVEAGWVDLALAGGTPVSDVSALEGLRLRRPVETGAPFLVERLEPAPAVTRGQPVLVTARAGAIQVDAVLVSLDDGRAGDRVRVQRDEDSEPYDVVVTGRGRAMVATAEGARRE